MAVAESYPLAALRRPLFWGVGDNLLRELQTSCRPSANVWQCRTCPVTCYQIADFRHAKSFSELMFTARSNDQLPGHRGQDRAYRMISKVEKGRWRFIETSDNYLGFADLDSLVDTHHETGRDMIFTAVTARRHGLQRAHRSGMHIRRWSGASI